MKALLIACTLLAVWFVMPANTAEAGWRTPAYYQRQVRRNVRTFDRNVRRDVRYFNNRRYYAPRYYRGPAFYRGPGIYYQGRNFGIGFRF